MRLLLVISAVGLVGTASAADVAVKPSRSDCIAGFRVDWETVSSKRADILNALDFPPRERQIESLVAVMFNRDRSALYLQFSRNCERKLELSNELFQLWHDQNIDLPRFLPIQEPIAPSPQTIDIKGVYWRD